MMQHQPHLRLADLTSTGALVARTPRRLTMAEVRTRHLARQAAAYRAGLIGARGDLLLLRKRVFEDAPLNELWELMFDMRMRMERALRGRGA